MNERLKEIIVNHGLHKYVTEDCQHRMEMLAKLVIKECAKIASNPAPGCHSSFGNIILEHFGVSND